MNNTLITILGPTASGKTSLAVSLAKEFNREIISGDSRQIYCGMDLGTGKDLNEYGDVPYHLIDIRPAGYKYNIFEYQKDFLSVFNNINDRGAKAILCGGSGMYIDAVIRGYELCEVAPNEALRKELEQKSLEELTEMLSSYKTMHNRSDVDTKKRAIRAIEIAQHYSTNPQDYFDYPKIDNIYIGINLERELRRERITRRLKERFEQGMINEVKNLLDSGVSAEDLIFYGLEYKFITKHVIGELSFDEMFNQLEMAIHQFAKRQMTWFRSMERKGTEIHWINGNHGVENMRQEAIKILIDKGVESL